MIIHQNGARHRARFFFPPFLYCFAWKSNSDILMTFRGHSLRMCTRNAQRFFGFYVCATVCREAVKPRSREAHECEAKAF